MLLVAIAAHADAGAGRRQLAAGVEAGADIHTHAAGAVAGVVGDVGQRGAALCFVAVPAFIHSLLRAGDGAAGQHGIAADLHIEAAVACLDAALLGNRRVLAVDLAGVVGEVAARLARAHGNAAADGLLVAAVGAGVLQAFDLQIARDIGRDLGRADGRAAQAGVAARLQRHLLAGVDFGWGPAAVLAVGIAVGATGACRGQQAAGANRHAHTGAGTAVAAAEAGAVVGGLQLQVTIGAQAGGVANPKRCFAALLSPYSPKPLVPGSLS